MANDDLTYDTHKHTHVGRDVCQLLSTRANGTFRLCVRPYVCCVVFVVRANSDVKKYSNYETRKTDGNNDAVIFGSSFVTWTCRNCRRQRQTCDERDKHLTAVLGGGGLTKMPLGPFRSDFSVVDPCPSTDRWLGKREKR